MKLASTIARYLLGAMFTIFGLNGFFHFIPQPPPKSELALQYFTVMTASHYLVLVFALQLIAGLLLLANRYVPLALVLLGPIVVNILMFHALMAPEGLPIAAVTTLLWLLVFWSVRGAFAGLFAPRAEPVYLA